MNTATKLMVLEWLAGDHSADGIERVAKFMRYLGIGGLRACRALVMEAVS